MDTRIVPSRSTAPAPVARALARRLARAAFMLLAAGTLIGVLHEQDAAVAALLGLGVMPFIYLRLARHSRSAAQKRLLLTGMLLSGLFGIQVELWGIGHGYWQYHDLRGGRSFAYWLPFAWMLSFVFLYRLEADLIRLLRLDSLQKKFALAAILAVSFPTWGEIITINLGVWTYHWPHQVFGVPLLAMGLLMVFHVGVFVLLTLACRIGRIEDPVFGQASAARGPALLASTPRPRRAGI